MQRNNHLWYVLDLSVADIIIGCFLLKDIFKILFIGCKDIRLPVLFLILPSIRCIRMHVLVFEYLTSFHKNFK